MASDATWDDVTRIVRGVSLSTHDDAVEGVFAIKDADDLQALHACLDAEADTHLVLLAHEDPATLRVGQSVGVSLAPRLGFGVIKQTLDELLSDYPRARLREPSFYLLQNGVSSVDPANPGSPVARYRAVLALIQTLKRAAAFLDSEEMSLVFVKNGKFEIPLVYSAANLAGHNEAVIQEIDSIIPSGVHQKQGLVILAEAVISLTETTVTEQRFAYLLTHLAELKKKFQQGYDLFASGFSYEKIRDQIEAARVEYTGKIHKVFSDIQNQLLSIPVATIIVATQLKPADQTGYAFWVNSAVLLGCWVFALLMILLLNNQTHTLKVLREEIRRQQGQLQREYLAIAGPLAETFTFLHKRARAQRTIILLIDAVVVGGVLLSTFAYLKLTPDARDWVVAKVPLLSHLF